MTQEQIARSLLTEHFKYKMFDDHSIVDEDWQRKLTKHRFKLIHYMCQPIKIFDYLISVDVIPRAVCSRIFHESRVPEDRNRALLDFLHGRTQNAFNYFVEALHLTSNEHLVLLLDDNFLLSHRRKQLDAEYRFPTAARGDIPTSIEDENLRKLDTINEKLCELDTIDEILTVKMATCEINDEEMKFDDEVQMGFKVKLLESDLIEQYPRLDPTTRPMKCYRMLSRPRGQCLLINNVDEFKTMPSREGSDIDASKLKSLFEQMGFIVLVRRNLQYTEMVSVLKNFADSLEKEKDNCDCAIVIILSHGTNGRIYAVDELSIDVEKQIIDVFDDHLIGKPKLFIFQACRGAQCDYRSESQLNTFYASDSANTDASRNTVDGGHSVSKTPKRSDMVIWYSTLKDFVSWRTSDQGSVFIQSLVTVFARTAWCYDLVDMMRCVNRTMKEKFSAHESTPFQTPCFEHHLDYPLYFNPGISDQ